MPDRQHNLGDFVSIHCWRGFNRRDLWWILLGFAGLLLLVGYGAWIFRSTETKNGAIAAFYRSEPWFMLAYLVFLSFMTLLLYRLWTSRRFVAVYQNGLCWRVKGFRTHTMTWDRLAGIAEATVETKFFRKTLSFEQRSLIYPKQAAPVEFDERLQDLPGLVNEIKKLFYPQIYPELLEEFNAGREIHFGPVTIQNQVLQVAKNIPTQDFLQPSYQPKRVHSVPWTQNLGLTVHSGFLVVKSGNSMMKRIPLSQIPNFEILLKMIEQGVKS